MTPRSSSSSSSSSTSSLGGSCIDNYGVDPNHLRGVTRYPTLGKALEVASPKTPQRRTQFRSVREVSPQSRCELLPQTRIAYNEKGRRTLDPSAESPQTLPQGKMVPETEFRRSIARYGKTLGFLRPLPRRSYSLEPPLVRDLLRTGEDSRPFLQQPVPPPPPEDRLAYIRLFDIPLVKNFDCLNFAADWRWEKMDSVTRNPKDRLTYEEAVEKKWCTSGTASALKKRFGRFGYCRKYITFATYIRLEEKEFAQPGGYIEYRREQARIRQARRRKNMSEKTRGLIRQADRNRYRKKCLGWACDGKIPNPRHGGLQIDP